MKYVYECEFKDKPECYKCILSITIDDWDLYCIVLDGRAKCPMDGHRLDCPLKLIKN